VAIYPGHLSLSAAAWNAKQDNKKYVVRHPPNADQDVALNPELPVNEVCPTQLIRSTDWR
jgi:hypothetical protein